MEAGSERASHRDQIGGRGDARLADGEAVAQRRRLLEDAPEDTARIVALAKALCSEQFRYAEAVGLYSRALALDPGDYDALRGRGGACLAILRLEEAAADLALCARRRPQEGDPLYRLGIAHYLAGRYESARECLAKALSLFSDGEMTVAAADWLWLACTRGGREDVAAEALRRVVPGMEVGHHTGYLLRCGVYSGRVGIGEALAQCERMQDDLEYTTAAYGIAACLEARGEGARALGLFREIVRRDAFWPSFGWLAARCDLTRRENAV